MSADDLYLKVELLEHTTAIVCAFVSHNAVPAGALPDLIASTHAALETIVSPAVEPPAATPRPIPNGLTAKNSVKDEHIVSFIDGKPYKSLRRHLGRRGFTPESYREAYGLARDYPMTAPAYSRVRAELAKQTGLGTPANRQGAAAPARQAA